MKIHQCLIFVMYIASLLVSSCGSGPREKKIEFVYLAFGVSDATGVGILGIAKLPDYSLQVILPKLGVK